METKIDELNALIKRKQEVESSIRNIEADLTSELDDEFYDALTEARDAMRAVVRVQNKYPANTRPSKDYKSILNALY